MSHASSLPDLPGNLLLRRPTLEDAAAVTGLINVCAVLETGAPYMKVEQLLCIWQSPGFDLATDAWLVVERDGGYIGYAEIWLQQGAGVPYFWLNVLPDAVGCGADVYLLRQAEARASQNTPGTPVVRTAAVSFNQTARRLLHRQGFRLTHRVWQTGHEGEQQQPWLEVPECVICRTYQPGDEDPRLCRYDVYEKLLVPAGMPLAMAS